MKAWTITCASLVNRDTCSKDLFEMYRALKYAYVEEMPTWKNSLKYAYVEI